MERQSEGKRVGRIIENRERVSSGERTPAGPPSFPGRLAAKSCHLVTGGTQSPESGGAPLLGASDQFSSEGTQMKTGSTEWSVQMNLV